LALKKKKIPYAELKQKLQLPDSSALEASVLDAVVSGRIDARIDQENELVIIKRASGRSFSSESWAQLAGKLNALKNNIHNTLNTLHTVQSRQRPNDQEVVLEEDI